MGEGRKEERKKGSKEGSKEGKRRILFEETCAFSHFCQSVFFRTMISFFFLLFFSDFFVAIFLLPLPFLFLVATCSLVFFFSQSFATMPRELCSKKSPFNPSLSF